MQQLALAEPLVRVRINHAHTLKEGWRVNETTVEITLSLAEEGPDLLRHLLEQTQAVAYEVGRFEAQRRNAQDGE